MTNEQYLIVSYFSAAGGGVAAAVLTAMLLRRRLRRAVSTLIKPMGRVMRRVLPTWLILLVLFAFMSVGYFGTCDHTTYKEVVEDRPWIVGKTHTQAYRMAICLAVGLLTFATVLAVTLVVCPRREVKENT